MGHLQTLRLILNRKNLLYILFIFFLYLFASISITNHGLVFATIFTNYPLYYKFLIISGLFLGLYTSLSTLDFYLLIITAFLVAFNLTLLALTLKNLKNSQLSLVVGGASILSIAAIGCTSCGLSVLSILGFSGALIFLPFDGLTVHIISLLLLLFSTFYMLKKFSLACKTRPR